MANPLWKKGLSELKSHRDELIAKLGGAHYSFVDQIADQHTLKNVRQAIRAAEQAELVPDRRKAILAQRARSKKRIQS